MIGVDIIDLHQNFYRRAPGAYREKLVSAGENIPQGLVHELPVIWAIKEAVYKCRYKKTGTFFLNPKKICIQHIDTGQCLFRARVNDEMYKGWYAVHTGFIYAVCSDADTGHHIYLPAQKEHSMEKETEFYRQVLGSPVSIFSSALGEDSFPDFLSSSEKRCPYSRSHDGDWYISVIAG